MNYVELEFNKWINNNNALESLLKGVFNSIFDDIANDRKNGLAEELEKKTISEEVKQRAKFNNDIMSVRTLLKNFIK
mgnify:CR=1 FL=1|jgi:hypothetical protein